MQHLSRCPTVLTLTLLAICGVSAVRAEQAGSGQASDVLSRVDQRYARADVDEEPDFQRHVVPLMGRLGCNGRACHGSFQGKGGFQLSLFGYDFEVDHKSLTEGVGDEGAPRIDRENPADSLILRKPTNADIHEGGLRYEKDGWEYRLLRRWIETGAKFDPQKITRLERLQVTPSEIVFHKGGETVQLQVVAVWSDGAKEDVTPLCRFQTNDEQTAQVTPEGLVTAGDPGDTHIVVFYDNGVVPTPVIRPVSDLAGEKYPDVAAPTRVDELVIQKLRKLGVVPSEVCTDLEFLRRVKLDLTGTLPTPQEIAQFAADPSPDKRAKKIDELLESPAYAAWWTTKLCDFTGNNDNELRTASPVRGQASQHWYDWIYRRVADNVPYDQLAEGIVLGQSRDLDESYLDYCQNMSDIARGDASFAERDCMPYYWARINLRQPEERVIGFAYSFLGIRIQCAQCHKHPFDQWSKSDFEQFTGFFNGITARNNANPQSREEYEELLKKLGVKNKAGNQLQRELSELLKQGEVVPFPEIYVTRQRRPARNQNARRGQPPAETARLLGAAEPIDLSQEADPRKPLMDWLRSADNPYFAKAFVNRTWAAYFHRGLVEPADDLSLANPASNGPVLDYLARGFVEHGFDMKWVHREILNTDAYQRSWTPNDTNEHDMRNFSRAVPRRLPAEVAYDALLQATASDAVVETMQTDLKGRAIALAGSNPRNNANGPNFALSVFGRSIRESNCDCDRSMEPSLLQTVFLQNDRDVLTMIDRRDGWVAQVAKEIGIRAPQAANDNDSDAVRARRQIAAITARLKNLRKQGDQETVERLERRLANLKRAAAQEGKPTSAAPSDAKSVDAAPLVEQAYLRTVSRYPNSDEAARSAEFIASYDNPLDGLRGLLWALINTKEFIVNH